MRVCAPSRHPPSTTPNRAAKIARTTPINRKRKMRLAEVIGVGLCYRELRDVSGICGERSSACWPSTMPHGRGRAAPAPCGLAWAFLPG